MPQQAMTQTFTLFPNMVALVPLEAIAGSSASITSFSDIDTTNSFVLNDASSEDDLLISEDGISLTYTKTSEAVQGFDAGGLGDIDDVTVQRELSIEIGVNGYSHSILAILMGLNPKNDIKDDFQFQKDGSAVLANGVEMGGNIKKEKFFFIARVPLDEEGAGDLYMASPKVVVEDQDIETLMQNQKVTYTIPFKGLKLLDSTQLSTLQTFAEPIQNGYELLFSWNAANESPGA